MTPFAKRNLLTLIDQLITEGQSINLDYSHDVHAIRKFTEEFTEWQAGCFNLKRAFGPHGSHWENLLDPKFHSQSDAIPKIIGGLKGIRKAIDGDYLLTVEDLVLADAFDDLLSQAEYLLSANHFLAAAILGRAVLEEHLRKSCDRMGCFPARPRPTLSDYYNELHKAGSINKIELAHLTAMASTGNAAAHNTGTLTSSDADRLLRDVRAFLLSHPIS